MSGYFSIRKKNIYVSKARQSLHACTNSSNLHYFELIYQKNSTNSKFFMFSSIVLTDFFFFFLLDVYTTFILLRLQEYTICCLFFINISFCSWSQLLESLPLPNVSIFKSIISLIFPIKHYLTFCVYFCGADKMDMPHRSNSPRCCTRWISLHSM